MTEVAPVRRVMIVEDELLVAMLIEDTLREHGFDVVGPFTNLTDAIAAAQTETADIALLDVNLRGQRVYPVAELLEARGIPFLLLSGYGSDAVPPNHAHWDVCGKPFLPSELTRQMEAIMGRSARRRGPSGSSRADQFTPEGA